MKKEELLEEKKKLEETYNRCWYELSELDRDAHFERSMELQGQKMVCQNRINEIDKQLEDL